jgi:hypothetical protein
VKLTSREDERTNDVSTVTVRTELRHLAGIIDSTLLQIGLIWH